MSTQPEGTVSNTPNTPSEPLALPAPSQDDETTKLDVHTMQRMKFDALGPMVVNSDGTLSRIANWPNMTPMERERTMRVLGARNQLRIANQERLQQEIGVSSHGEGLSAATST